MKIGLVSFDPVWLEPRSNMQRALDLINNSFFNGCDIIVFPEMTLTGFSPQYGSLDANFLDECISLFGKTAIRNNLYVVFGALSFLDNSNPNLLPTNNAFVISPSGELISSYSKIHLFSFGEEHLFVRPGDQLSIFPCFDVDCSLSICYDLRFPEIYSGLANKTKLFINIASWPSHRTDHWQTLLKARAIETQAYMIGVNRTGNDGNALSYDLSTAVYDPLGKSVPLVSSAESDLLSVVNVDFSVVDQTRSSFGVLNDKKYSLYHSLLPVS